MIFWVAAFLVLMVLGCILGYVLNLYLLGAILLIILVGVSWLFWELKVHPTPSGTSGGLGFLILAIAGLVMVAGILVGLTLYYVPWTELVYRISSMHPLEFLRTHIFR